MDDGLVRYINIILKKHVNTVYKYIYLAMETECIAIGLT